MTHSPIVAGVLVAWSMSTNVVAHLQAVMYCCLHGDARVLASYETKNVQANVGVQTLCKTALLPGQPADLSHCNSSIADTHLDTGSQLGMDTGMDSQIWTHVWAQIQILRIQIQIQRQREVNTNTHRHTHKEAEVHSHRHRCPHRQCGCKLADEAWESGCKHVHQKLTSTKVQGSLKVDQCFTRSPKVLKQMSA